MCNEYVKERCLDIFLVMETRSDPGNLQKILIILKLMVLLVAYLWVG